MKIIITGGTGLIGSALAKNLAEDGHKVILLSRKKDTNKKYPEGVQLETWDGHTAQGWWHHIEGADAIVNLAGENLSAGRWTDKRKSSILSSRIHAGAAVVQAVNQTAEKPKLVIQISGVGAYGVSEHVVFDERFGYGDDFLANVCKLWEASTSSVEEYGIRRIVARFGVVLSTHSGALPRMLMPFKLFVGGPLGNGRQWLSWIHLEDAIRVLRYFIETPNVKGVFNVSGEPLTNRQFSREIGRALHRPAFFTTPAFAVRVVFGEMGTLVLDGQKVSTQKLKDNGFRFQFVDAHSALHDLLKR